MDVSKLQGAQSFNVQKLDKPPSAEELKALENNGKVDIVIQEGGETVILSGESIDINEYNTKMGEAVPSYEMGPYYNPDLKPLKNMDTNNDGKLTEAETQMTLGEAFSEGLDRAGNTIGGGWEVGAYKGMGMGHQVAGHKGMVAGSYVGRVVGGLVGLVASPFTGSAETYKNWGAQKDVQTWNFTETLKDIR